MGNTIDSQDLSFTPEDRAFLQDNGIALPHPEDTKPDAAYPRELGGLSLHDETDFDIRHITDTSMSFTITRTNTAGGDSHADDADQDS